MGIGGLLLLVLGSLTQGFGEISLAQALIIAWLALVNTAFAFTLWNRTLRTLTAVESSILNGMMLPQIALLAWVFLDEPLSARQIAGLLLVGGGTLLVQLAPLWGGVGAPRAAPQALNLVAHETTQAFQAGEALLFEHGPHGSRIVRKNLKVTGKVAGEALAFGRRSFRLAGGEGERPTRLQQALRLCQERAQLGDEMQHPAAHGVVEGLGREGPGELLQVVLHQLVRNPLRPAQIKHGGRKIHAGDAQPGPGEERRRQAAADAQVEQALTGQGQVVGQAEEGVGDVAVVSLHLGVVVRGVGVVQGGEG